MVKKRKITGLAQSRHPTKSSADKLLKTLRKNYPDWEHRKIKVQKGWKVISVRR